MSDLSNPTFDRYIGIDYSGAATPTSSLKGLRIYQADHAGPAVEVRPPPSPRKYWTRRGVAEWLVQVAREDVRTLVGIDHAFSFPIRYFEVHGLPPDWPLFLDDFHRHWPTDEDDLYVDFVRDGLRGNGAARSGETRWRRLTEVRAGGAKSVFQFDVQGQVAKSTHAGLPWLRYLRQQVGHRVHFWPFEGWTAPDGRSAIVEVYPSLWSRGFDREDRNGDQHDAYSVAEWMRRADLDGSLRTCLAPALEPEEQALAQVEGWILGVMGPVRAETRRRHPAHAQRKGAREPAGAMFDRITFDPKVLGGRACIRGMRISVSLILRQIAQGATPEEILKDYPDLELSDLRQALKYAAWLTQED